MAESHAEACFAKWQPRYAAHGIATFPVKIQDGNKVPAVSGWQRVDLRTSTVLAAKFATAASFGFTCGPRNQITVVDMDSTNESIVPESEDRFGRSPILWRTGGGKFAMAFRYNGEPRLIRAFGEDGPPIDLLGAGFAVAPPSAGVKRPYEFLRGSLADFDSLPVARIPKEIRNDDAAGRSRERIPKGTRENDLFRYCRSTVVYCDTLDALIDAARTWADQRLAVVPDKVSDVAVRKTCNSVWQYRGGRKRIMNQIVDAPQWAELSAHPELLGVLAYLQAENGPDSNFMIADGLGAALGWSRRLVPAARKMFLEIGVISEVRRPGKSSPGLYRWNPIDDQLAPNLDIPNLVGNPYSPSPPSPRRVRASEGRTPASSVLAGASPAEPHATPNVTPSRRKASR